MSDRVLSAVLTAEEATRELPMQPITYFFIAFGLFLVLLAVTWSFRNTAYKHQQPRSLDEHEAIESDGTRH